MKDGIVVGELWASKRAEGLAGRRLLLVHSAGDARALVALDAVAAGRGDRVLVSWGSGARLALASGADSRRQLADAAVAMIIDADSLDANPTGTNPTGTNPTGTHSSGAAPSGANLAKKEAG